MINAIERQKFFLVPGLLAASLTFATTFAGTYASVNDIVASPNAAEYSTVLDHHQAVILNKVMDRQNALDVKSGTWGGRGISFVVEKNSAVIELDCGRATISSRLRTRKDGKFTATGLMTRSGPGPVMCDAPRRAQQVRFEGKVSGKQMTLKITLVDSGALVGDYTLERGMRGELTRCY